ncbi:hypothetical protein AAC387_Pa04g0815 [Persea americana]
MPDLSNLVNPSSSFRLSPCDSVPSPSSMDAPKPQTLEEKGRCRIWNQRMRHPVLGGSAIRNGVGISVPRKNRKRPTRRGAAAMAGKSLEDHVRAWVEKKVASGVPERECSLPFLVNAPKMEECRICGKCIYSGEKLLCSVNGCKEAFHIGCAEQRLKFSTTRNFRCPQHACFNCKQKAYWRCMRCTVAAHTKCAPWPERVIYPISQPGRAVCWRHPTDWRLEKKHAVPTSDIEEIFRRLPIPYVDEEFTIDFSLKDVTNDEVRPSPYIHIRRNVYLVKKKRDDADADVGCTNCDAGSMCSEDCVCRVQSISCSKACHCSDMCTNRPFRKDKKVKIVKTQYCGWGVEAAESIKKEEFVIEYIGEVINDALCEERLWAMKYRGDQNFYMCEIRKDFTIDATFKGNASRFLNHSCDPNCKLEKWEVDGETRVGVFASRSIEAGEPLTYDYRFVHFGPMVACCCGSFKCRGYLGSKKKTEKVVLRWGAKRKRSKMIMML